MSQIVFFSVKINLNRGYLLLYVLLQTFKELGDLYVALTADHFNLCCFLIRLFQFSAFNFLS